MTERDEVLEAIAGVKKTLETVDKNLSAIRNYGKRTRQLFIGLVCSLVIDVALTVTVGILSFNASSESSAVHSVQVANCNSANIERMKEVRLWSYVISLSVKAMPNETPSQRAARLSQLQDLAKFISGTFAPLHCPS
jgi:hypothetical protein